MKSSIIDPPQTMTIHSMLKRMVIFQWLIFCLVFYDVSNYSLEVVLINNAINIITDFNCSGIRYNTNGDHHSTIYRQTNSKEWTLLCILFLLRLLKCTLKCIVFIKSNKIISRRYIVHWNKFWKCCLFPKICFLCSVACSSGFIGANCS